MAAAQPMARQSSFIPIPPSHPLLQHLLIFPVPPCNTLNCSQFAPPRTPFGYWQIKSPLSIPATVVHNMLQDASLPSARQNCLWLTLCARKACTQSAWPADKKDKAHSASPAF